MPLIFSHRLVKGRNPQIFGSGFSLRLNVGRSNSCSTLSRLSSGATKYRWIRSRFGLQGEQITHPQEARVYRSGAFHLERRDDGVTGKPKDVNRLNRPRGMASLNWVGNRSTILDIAPRVVPFHFLFRSISRTQTSSPSSRAKAKKLILDFRMSGGSRWFGGLLYVPCAGGCGFFRLRHAQRG